MKKKNIELYMAEYYKSIKFIESDKNKSINLLREIYEKRGLDVNVKTIIGIKLAELIGGHDGTKIFLEIYELHGNDIFLKNVAVLNALNNMINEKKDEKEIRDLIVKISQNNNPLLNLVKEQEALFELQLGNNEKGIEILNEINNNFDTDELIKKRIENYLNIY
jgi:hypothetical protein